MPMITSYPGVYIEELPSGVRSITGVATSIAAFIGWAPQGSTQPQLVLSWSDFNRQFGGLDSRSLLGYAVSQFFQNGGSQAYIIRLVDGSTAGNTAKTATLPLDPITVSAQNPGDWANSYGVVIQQNLPTGRFRLQVVSTSSSGTQAVVESFENLSITTPDPSGRYVVDVVNHGSAYISVAVTTGATTLPANTSTDGTHPLTTSLLSGGDPGAVLKPSTVIGTPSTFDTTVAAPATQSLLDQIDQFNLLCVPGEIVTDTLSKLEAYCEKRRAFLIADSDSSVTDPAKLPPPGIAGTNAAFYYPWLQAPDPLSATGAQRPYPPCGFVAGMYARTDASRGVWKAPAGTETALVGVSGVAVPLTDDQNGLLNQVAVNCIRNFPVYGTIIWGARTVQGADQAASQWKYVPVRRLAMYLEESLYRGLKWAVFEPNDAPLWGQIRLNVGAFMQTLFRQGAFQGTTPQQAYFVKCDNETTTAADQNNGIVNILVGFAPLKPAEFVVLQLQQIAGQAAA
jgi:uncharacterized protein